LKIKGIFYWQQWDFVFSLKENYFTQYSQIKKTSSLISIINTAGATADFAIKFCRCFFLFE